MDSGAFTEISHHGNYRTTPEEYAAEIRRQAGNGNLLAAVAQDWMCEPWIVARTGLSVAEHQPPHHRAYYDRLVSCDTAGVYVLPVLQGARPPSTSTTSKRTEAGAVARRMWVGVGSVCKHGESVLSKSSACSRSSRKRDPTSGSTASG